MENKLYTLKSKQDFLNLKENGQTIFTKKGLIFSYAENKRTFFAWTVSRYVGNAVLRNKLKRFCREAVKENLSDFNNLSLSINVIFPSKKQKTFQTIRFNEINEAFKEFIKKYKQKNC